MPSLSPSLYTHTRTRTRAHTHTHDRDGTCKHRHGESTLTGIGVIFVGADSLEHPATKMSTQSAEYAISLG